MDAVTGIGALVFLAGYTLTWFGYARLKGPGMGILDLIVPSHLEAALGTVAGWAPVGGPGINGQAPAPGTATPGPGAPGGPPRNGPAGNYYQPNPSG